MPTLVTGDSTPINTPQNTPETPATPQPTAFDNKTSGTIPTANAQYVIPTIVDQNVPVVVFVGPPSSGKSMILVRLAKYLRSIGFMIKTDETFLNTAKYQKDCAEFNNKLNTQIALDGTVEFLLVDIYSSTGELIAKLLEAPGEDFYTTDPQKISAGENERVKSYLATIMASRNPKSYVTLLDLDSEISFRRDGNHRDSYQQRFLNHFYKSINKNRDKIILLYNKIDKTMFGDINGCNNLKGARLDAMNYYKQWFSTMKISKFLFTVDNFTFKTFCTGIFSEDLDAHGQSYQTYRTADDIYPRELWKEIISKW